MISQQKIVAFQKYILEWYHENQRDLPWRKTRNPYCILISEVMSQQTQLSRVIPKYKIWLTKFPTVQILAEAKVSEVLEYWNGLGYNRRALNLQKCAQNIVKKYGGIFPQTESELLVLPGIGQYTARALLCFAFDQQIAVVDTNVRKVILTKFLNVDRSGFGLSDSQNMSKKGIDDKVLQEIATQLLPKKKAYEWNQALMDYASTVLKKEKISIPKQSKFHGSHRYYRGQVLKVLLEKKKVSLDNIGLFIKKDYSFEDSEWLYKLLKELEKEGFLFIKRNQIELSS
ncbi:MAG TPA: hypothetical protein VNW29_06390 [Candidatus Sulfotelmatobacter sp.]|jgi:A/G-specific adenine glycosylase|nr:hypothetical protein [Candidatus Sulfotelmatobacter sp.]